MAGKNKDDGFNLAFLDVMACGLGAVLLILILVKFNANSNDPANESQRLEQELSALQDQTDDVKQNIENVETAILREHSTIGDVQSKIKRLKIEKNAARSSLKNNIAVVANLEQSVAAAAPKESDDLLSMEGGGEEEYVIGLKVEGKQIGILLDASASMTADTIVEGIKIKIGSDSKKQSGPKWVRAVRTAKWLLARLPEESKVSVVAYNNKAVALGARPTHSPKVKSSMQKLAQEIIELVPHEGTNLQVGLQKIKDSMPGMTDLYVITDGLPTLGKNSSGLATFTKCGSFFGKSQTISGECRANLFSHTIKITSLSGVKVNVILLPLEGDPDAPFFYWKWTASTGGIMISPASTWP
jgi:hypothetical protein